MIDIADLKARMEKAVTNLEELADQARPEQTERKARLRGKAEGVALALSYLKDQPEIDTTVTATPSELALVMAGRTLTFDGGVKLRLPTPEEFMAKHVAACAELGIAPTLDEATARDLCRPTRTDAS